MSLLSMCRLARPAPVSTTTSVSSPTGPFMLPRALRIRDDTGDSCNNPLSYEVKEKRKKVLRTSILFKIFIISTAKPTPIPIPNQATPDPCNLCVVSSVGQVTVSCALLGYNPNHIQFQPDRFSVLRGNAIFRSIVCLMSQSYRV